MTDAMDVDADAGARVESDMAPLALDKVSLLQESVDKMALSMFNALRLLPAGSGDRTETATAVGFQRF